LSLAYDGPGTENDAFFLFVIPAAACKKTDSAQGLPTGKAHFYNLSNLKAFVNIFIKKLPKN